ncbi:MAG: hypothetical protein Q8P40_10960 [Nitrospirota bacterium]|nr:hypothetical protein [Nitrospirota bacterium]
MKRPLTEDDEERRKMYREFVRGMLNNKDAMKGEMDRRRIYGSEEFSGRIAKAYKTEAEIKPKGRPRKAENAVK